MARARVQVKELQEEILRPRLLRRLKEDVEKSIPKKEEVIIWVELTRQQRVYYKALFEQSIGTLLKGAKPQNLPNLRNLVSATQLLHGTPLGCRRAFPRAGLTPLPAERGAKPCHQKRGLAPRPAEVNDKAPAWSLVQADLLWRPSLAGCGK